MECCRRPDRTTADRTETHGTHRQRTYGSLSENAPSSISSLSFGSIIFSRCPHRNDQTVSRTGFGNGSGDLSTVSENFWARKKRLIYQSLFSLSVFFSFCKNKLLYDDSKIIFRKAKDSKAFSSCCLLKFTMSSVKIQFSEGKKLAIFAPKKPRFFRSKPQHIVV